MDKNKIQTDASPDKTGSNNVADCVKNYEQMSHQNQSAKRTRTRRERVFVPSKSILTELFENKHFEALYNLFMAILLMQAALDVILKYSVEGLSGLRMSTFSYGFRGFPYVLGIWLMMQTYVFLFYIGIKLWQRVFQAAACKTGCVAKGVNVFSICCYVALQVLLCTFSSYLLINLDMGPASRLGVLLEQLRFMMKAHSFVVENVRNTNKALEKQADEEPKQVTAPTLKQYAYFLVVPTLLYRDNYPRTNHPIRWKKVLGSFLEVFGCTMYGYYTFEYCIIPANKGIGAHPLEAVQIVRAAANCIVGSVFIFLCSFYGFNHAWMNAFAELTGFADRRFYGEWWTITNYTDYFRKWNVIVHDFIHAYIYQDIAMMLGSRLGMFFCIVISAVMHEYVWIVTFQFLSPSMSVIYLVCGNFVILISGRSKNRLWNCAMWFGQFLCVGLMIFSYTFEFYARNNCQRSTINDWRDILVPRVLSCDRS